MIRRKVSSTWWRVAAACLMPLMLSACAAGPAPIDHYYSVEIPAPSDPSGPQLSGTLHVDPLRTDGLVGQRHLLYRVHEGRAEVRQYGYHHWTDAPAIGLQTSLVRYLRKAGVAKVVMESNARTRADYTVTGRVHRFERVLDPAPAIVVEIDLTVTTSDGELLLHENYRDQRAAGDVPQAVSAIGEAVHDIFARFVSGLRASVGRSQQE